MVHTFVLIGANSRIHEGHRIEHKLDQAKRGFGNDAIICDPWLGGGKVFVVDQWMEAVKQMIEEAAPGWNDPAKIDFAVTANSSNLNRDQKVALWKAKPHYWERSSFWVKCLPLSGPYFGFWTPVTTDPDDRRNGTVTILRRSVTPSHAVTVPKITSIWAVVSVHWGLFLLSRISPHLLRNAIVAGKHATSVLGN
jgi:hypothetical protein